MSAGGAAGPPSDDQRVVEAIAMRFLCLAYGAEEGWLALSDERRAEVVAADEAVAATGALVAQVAPPVTVRAWDGPIERTAGPYPTLDAPLVGFSIVEVDTIDEVIELVGRTPCAVAGGAIEVRALLDGGDR
jgi:hypothetical protein